MVDCASRASPAPSKARVPGPRVVDTRSSFFPDTREVIGWNIGGTGWNIGGTGFEIVLTAGVADVIERHFPVEVAAFLADNGRGIADVAAWVAHPGGPRLLDAFAQCRDLQKAGFVLRCAWLARGGALAPARPGCRHATASACRARCSTASICRSTCCRSTPMNCSVLRPRADHPTPTMILRVRPRPRTESRWRASAAGTASKIQTPVLTPP